MARGSRNGNSFRLVGTDWEGELHEAMRLATDRLRIICPFIKLHVVERLLGHGSPRRIEVLTRFELREFAAGVSDTSALRHLLDHGARIRGIQNLHAKVYQFGSKRVIVTSANLTRKALQSNHEFGIIAGDPEILESCESYFDELWAKAAPDLKTARVEEWNRKVCIARLRGTPPDLPGLRDEGRDVGLPEANPGVRPAPEIAFPSFVKFFGEGHYRADHSLPVRDEVARAGCNRVCTYPKGKRPRQVEDGSVLFTARLVRKPNDIIVFGRAIGHKYRDGKDDASLEDIRRRQWVKRWPHYIRVDHAEFLAGTMKDGVSLNTMMNELGKDAFASTQRNARAGKGNTDPRQAYRSSAAVQLTSEGYAWLSNRLNDAFAKQGRIPKSVLAGMNWPS